MPDLAIWAAFYVRKPQAVALASDHRRIHNGMLAQQTAQTRPEIMPDAARRRPPPPNSPRGCERSSETACSACLSDPPKSPTRPTADQPTGAAQAGLTTVPARSGDLELLVAEVGDELQSAAEGGDVAVQDVLGGDVAAFDLGDPGN